jgi:hypothetical protein
MAGSNNCFSMVRGRAMRVTRLDGCGSVDLGPDAAIASDGFITVQFTAQTEEGETISVTNAAGKICILDEPCPTFTGYEVQVEFCGVNPLLLELMTGQASVTDAEGNRNGFRMNTGVDACASGFALEVWSGVPSAVCDPGSGVSYGYFLVPFLKGGVVGDFSIGNDAVNFTLSGAKSKDGNNWGVGPYDVVKDDVGAPGPLLEPLDSRDHLHMELTSVPPPDPDCTPIAVGVPATGATSGIPGTWTPIPAYGPDNLAALQASSIVASPATAWSANSYVILEDGTYAYWDGSAWAAGKAPGA